MQRFCPRGGGYPIPPAELVVGPFGGELLETEQKSSAACGSKESMGIQDERFLVLPQYADAGKCVFS